MRRLQVGVIGPGKGEYPQNEELRNKVEKLAEKTGELIAEKNCILITGGMDGAMEAASRGAASRNGTIIGTPGRTRNMSNRYVNVEFLTPIDIGDFLFSGTWSCDAFIVIPGGAGTLAELCLAYRAKKPIVILKNLDKSYDKYIGGYIDEGKSVKIYGAETPQEAVDLVLGLIRDRET